MRSRAKRLALRMTPAEGHLRAGLIGRVIAWPRPTRRNGPRTEALAAAPANHRLLFEDDAVRVLEVTVQPGERENLHHHRWPSIMVVLARPNYRNFDADGNEIPRGGTPASPVLPRALRLPARRRTSSRSRLTRGAYRKCRRLSRTREGTRSVERMQRAVHVDDKLPCRATILRCGRRVL